MKKHVLYWLALGLIVLAACQKETSFELGGSPGAGSLQSDVTGDCFPKTISGTYIAGALLVPTVSTMTVSVNVTQTGTYVITTDTVNGYYFNASGTFTTLGPTNVILRGNGTPFAAGVNNFVVSYNGTICDIQVTVLPSGAPPAIYTMNGAPGSCTTPTISGSYILGTALTASNTVVLNVTVTTAGTYNITTAPAVNGMTFAGTGTLALGAQTIALIGTGTPTLAGNNTIPITIGSSTCSFVIAVVSGAAGTLDGGPTACTPVTVNGTYTVGTALTAANTVQVRIDVTTAGPYTISTNTVTGFSFTKSGTVAVGNDQLITLDGIGTPTTAGTQTFTVTFGTSTCTFTVPVTGPSGAVGTLDGAPTACTPVIVNGGYRSGTLVTTCNTAQIRVDVTTGGAYTITTNTVTGFSFSKTGTIGVGNDQLIILDGTGTPTTAGVQTFTVTFGTSTCTFTVPVQAILGTDYFPRTANSNWSYEWDDNALDSFYRVVLTATHSALGNTWNIFMMEDGTAPGLDSSGYYRKSGGDYFEWFDYGSWLGLDGPGWGEYILLKDNVAQGTNWKTGTFNGTAGGTPIQVRFSYTLIQKDVAVSITSSLCTINYTNVNVVEEKIEVFDPTFMMWVDATAAIDYFGKSYYARGIGLIKFEALDAGGVVTDKQELRRSVIY